ncbi:MAG: thymidylate kinase [Candidatus Marsarchaeota archaeon]|nr:thymidylate kinase [Candidatus Marsarchaeota archaeon]
MAYIMIEGPEGAGKTEGAARLFAGIKSAGYDVMVNHEPGNGTLGTLVRATLSGIKKHDYERLKSFIRDGSEIELLLDHLTSNEYRGPKVIDTIKSDYSTIKGLIHDDTVFDKLLESMSAANKIDVESLQLLFTAVRSEDMKRLKPFLERRDMAVISDRGYPSTITYAESSGPNKAYADFLKLINSRFPKPDKLFILYAPPEILLKRVQQRGGIEERFDKLESIRNISDSYRRNFPDAFYIDASQSREKVYEELFNETMRVLNKLGVSPVYKTAD